MDKNKEDIISRKFREKLEDYELPVRDDLWTKITQDLPPVKKRIHPLWITAGSVAASIALILSLYLGISDPSDKPVEGIVQTEIFEKEPKQTINQIVHEVVETKGEFYSTGLVKGSPKPKTKEVIGEERKEREEIKQEVKGEEQEVKGEEKPLKQQEKTEKTLPSLDNFDSEFWKEDILSKKKKNDLSLALAFSGQEGSSSYSNNQTLLRYSEQFSVSAMNEKEMADNVVILDTKHKTPITVAFAVRKPLNDKWALESGLAYTYLETSEIKTQTNGNNFSDTYELHYLGIPLKAVYSVYNREKLSIYASAGGMMEKCVSGRVLGSLENTKEKLDVPDLQWSVGGNVGVSYEIIKKLNLFVEPGINYYFDDKSGIPTIRKDKPLNFNLQLGIRLDI
ncbi:PorT family protein [Bacteroidales bacterium OttesenSCG-928-A17]|nr:PorT family protein [Bacteroidales bacterium OttesenSCG-928-A17]